MQIALKILVGLPALLFLTLGIRWLVDPAGVAPEFGFELSTGIGLSSQIGDMSGYFLAMSLCMFLAIITGHKTWFYPPVMLLTLTAAGRVLAWAVHDAALAIPMIAVEVVVSAILLTASRVLSSSEKVSI